MSEPRHRGVPGLRRTTLIEPGDGIVRAEVEDDFHNFQLSLLHDGRTILSVETAAPRYPWQSCAGAGGFLAALLAGTPLADAPSFDAQLSHCTHLYDLALLAAAHALDAAPLRYEAFVSDAAAPTRAEAYRNDRLVLAWDLVDGVIQPPGEPAGETLRRLKHWLPSRPESEHEAAIYLRRAVFISGGRRSDHRVLGEASDLIGQEGACYTFQPERARGSFWIPESRRDFTDTAAPPLARAFATPSSTPPVDPIAR